jgi:ferric-dicitrate binding protein FerR (iron transport regulator)
VTGNGPDTPADDVGEERALRESLRVESLTSEAMWRVRSATEAEWRSLYQQKSRRRWPYAVAASAVLVCLLAGLPFVGPGSGKDAGEVAARLVRFETPGVAEIHAVRRAERLVDGAVLRSGHRYWSAGQSLLQLEGGGNLRLAADSSIEILAKSDVRLESGEFYVDIPPGSRSNVEFIARTSSGEFHHVGTQFALAVNNGETRLRVREGSVRWLAAAGESTVSAGSEVVFANGTKVAERTIETSGTEWDWTARSTPDFDIEDRSLGEFLEWVARESGRKLTFVDDRARKKIASIRMHGSVHGLTPLQALSAIMAATELRYELPDGQIRVSFAGDIAPRK